MSQVIGVRTALATLVLVALCLGTLPATECYSAEDSVSVPRTIYWDGVHLAKIRAASEVLDPRQAEALERLRNNAEISRKRGPYSVMDKADVAPSGDRHDYLSYARYWWPNPDTKDGFPYIRR